MDTCQHIHPSCTVCVHQPRFVEISVQAGVAPKWVAPVHLTLTLALELVTSASHPSPTLWANPVQNAGEHFLRRSETAQSDKRHVSPRHDR
jgi:hypothetical protein